MKIWKMMMVSCLLLMPVVSQGQQTDSKPTKKDHAMSKHAEGSFDVKVIPLTADEATTGTAIGRYGLAKHFHGGMEGSSKGEMMGAGNVQKGIAGYVAVEEFTGTLDGHKGSFALQHNSTMDSGKFEMNIVAVPGSGTGELEGIAGTMKILITEGKHSYQFDYTLPDAK